MSILLAAYGTAATTPGSRLAWTPERSPEGPILIVIGLAEQRAFVYRNGIRIGVTAVSTGRPGFDTPSGVYTILEKRREHYSNLYDNAPMPFMQRLTWSGLALHAGQLPGSPASHGCVRLPYAFAEKLFAITRPGTTVIVLDAVSTPAIVSPGPLTAADAVPATRRAPTWEPQRALDGPMTIVMSTRDREVVVLRKGIEIGRAPVDLEGDTLAGRHVFVLLAGTEDEPSAVVPDRPALRWLEVPLDENASRLEGGLRRALAEGVFRVDRDFAIAIYDVLEPGATLLITGEPIRALVTTPAPSLLEATSRPADARQRDSEVPHP